MQEWIYVNNDDNTSRYVLGTKGDKPVFCFGINPSTAEPDNLDPTLKNVSSISLSNGYDSWIMFNVYPKRDTIFENLESIMKDEEHQKNLAAIVDIISQYEEVDIWAAESSARRENLRPLRGPRRQDHPDCRQNAGRRLPAV